MRNSLRRGRTPQGPTPQGPTPQGPDAPGTAAPGAGSGPHAAGPHLTHLSPARRRLVLAVMALALMMVVSAVSGLNVALPDLARSTGASQGELTWIVDAYTVVFAGLLLGAGAVGDRHGRRTVLIVGLVVFGAGAAVAMSVDDTAWLVTARAVMGVGAACVMPSTLSVITTSFPEAERGRAVGVWVGVAGGGAVLGLFVSGLLLQWFAWNSFFGLNVVLAVLALAGTLAVVPDSREAAAGPIDVAGAVLGFVAVSSLVTAVVQGTEDGWGTPAALAAACAATLGTAGFVARQLTAAHPLLDVRLFARRGFGAGSASVTVQFFASFGFFFVVLQYLQFVVGRSPLEAAATLLPLPLVLVPTARTAPHLAARLGTNAVGAVGLALIAVGLAVFAQLGTGFSAVHFYGGLVCFGLGMGLAGTPATTAITASLPPEKQGVASAVNDVSRELGSALGIALLGSLLSSTYRAEVEASSALQALPAAAREAVAASVAVVDSDRLLSLGAAGQAVADAARAAFVAGVHDALTAAAVAALAGAVFVAWRAPRHEQTH